MARIKRKPRGKNRYIHGMATPEHRNYTTYVCWKVMKQRCVNPRDIGYKNYGARGITIDRSWEDFTNFFKDMGRRPKGYTIERIDNDKGYSKDNCKWATYTEQANNKRSTIWVDIKGECISLSNACRRYNIERVKVYNIMKQGIPFESAIGLVIAKQLYSRA